jgi:hypothetical protein
MHNNYSAGGKIAARLSTVMESKKVYKENYDFSELTYEQRKMLEKWGLYIFLSSFIHL